MAEKYELMLHDGYVYMKEYKISKKIKLLDLAKELVKVDKSFSTPDLPDNCIRYLCNGKNNMYLIHIPMGTYKVKYLHKEYIVTYPHQIFYFKYSSLDTNDTSKIETKLFWSYDKILNIDKGNFNVPALHNIYDTCKLCTGRLNPGKNQVEDMNNFITSFFENEFNNDLSTGKRHLNSVSSEQKEIFDVNEEDNLVKQSKLWLKDTNLKFQSSYKLSFFIGDL